MDSVALQQIRILFLVFEVRDLKAFTWKILPYHALQPSQIFKGPISNFFVSHSHANCCP